MIYFFCLREGFVPFDVAKIGCKMMMFQTLCGFPFSFVMASALICDNSRNTLCFCRKMVENNRF